MKLSGILWDIVLFCGVISHKPYSNMSFIGEYEVTLDAKGRFSLPAGFRKQLQEGAEARGFVLSRGLGKFLNLYTRDVWDLHAAKLLKLNDFNTKVRAFKTLILGSAVEVFPDSAGRVLIPKQQQQHAQLTKSLIFASVGNKIEIWDKEIYEQFIAEQSENLDALADSLFGESLMDPFDDPTNPSI